MTALPAYASAAAAVFKRDLLIFVSYRARVVSLMIMVAFSVTLFYYLSKLVSVEQFRSPEQYFAFVVVGLLLLRGITDIFGNTVATVRQELVAGTFERMIASPFGATAGTISATMFPFALALCTSSFTLAFAAIAFGVPLNWATAPLAAPAGLLAAFAFLPFALVAAAVVILFKQATGAVRFVVVALSFASGFYFPVDLLPSWLQWLSEVQPLTPAVELMRHLLIGTPLDSPWVEAAKLAGFAVVFLPLSYLTLKGAIALGRRRATITEY